MKKLWIVLLMLGFGSPAAAQGDGIDQDRAAKEIAGKMLLAADKQKLVAEMRYKVAVEARTTTGAPYSAEAVTESTQVLADGNRINQKSVTRVYRDGEGRTRREELDDAGTVVSVSIVDPVAHANYVLQPASRTAHRESVWVEMPKIEGASWGRGMIVYPDGDRPDSAGTGSPEDGRGGQGEGRSPGAAAPAPGTSAWYPGCARESGCRCGEARGPRTSEYRRRGGNRNALDDHDCRRRDWESAAHQSGRGAVVLTRPPGAGLDEAQRPSHGRDDVSPPKHRARGARSIAVLGAA